PEKQRAFGLDSSLHTTTALCCDWWDKRLMPLHCTFHKKIFADYSVACWEKKYKSRLINGLLK
ncbi:hypothetical protein OFN17_32425, partial [Escherichia coli]|nr:hypothetical protein [Escherichia coli]